MAQYFKKGGGQGGWVGGVGQPPLHTHTHPTPRRAKLLKGALPPGPRPSRLGTATPPSRPHPERREPCSKHPRRSSRRGSCDGRWLLSAETASGWALGTPGAAVPLWPGRLVSPVPTGTSNTRLGHARHSAQGMMGPWAHRPQTRPCSRPDAKECLSGTTRGPAPALRPARRLAVAGERSASGAVEVLHLGSGRHIPSQARGG